MRLVVAVAAVLFVLFVGSVCGEPSPSSDGDVSPLPMLEPFAHDNDDTLGAAEAASEVAAELETDVDGEAHVESESELAGIPSEADIEADLQGDAAEVAADLAELDEIESEYGLDAEAADLAGTGAWETDTDTQTVMLPAEDVGEEAAEGESEGEGEADVDEAEPFTGHSLCGKLIDGPAAVESDADMEGESEAEAEAAGDELSESEGEALLAELERESATVEGAANRYASALRDREQRDQTATNPTLALLQERRALIRKHLQQFRNRMAAIRACRLQMEQQQKIESSKDKKLDAVKKADDESKKDDDKMALAKRALAVRAAKAKSRALMAIKKAKAIKIATAWIKQFDPKKGKLFAVTMKLKGAFIARSKASNEDDKDADLKLAAKVNFKLKMLGFKPSVMESSPSKELECVAPVTKGSLHAVRRLPVLRAVQSARRHLSPRHAMMKKFIGNRHIGLKIIRLSIAKAIADLAALKKLGLMTNIIAGARLSVTFHFIKPVNNDDASPALIGGGALDAKFLLRSGDQESESDNAAIMKAKALLLKKMQATKQHQLQQWQQSNRDANLMRYIRAQRSRTPFDTKPISSSRLVSLPIVRTQQQQLYPSVLSSRFSSAVRSPSWSVQRAQPIVTSSSIMQQPILARAGKLDQPKAKIQQHRNKADKKDDKNKEDKEEKEEEEEEEEEEKKEKDEQIKSKVSKKKDAKKETKDGQELTEQDIINIFQ